MNSTDKSKDGLVQIFTKKIKLRNGKVIYASQYGLNAFYIWVKPKK